MYFHGLCTIALGEAYGMSTTRSLGTAAQRGVNYIIEGPEPSRLRLAYEPKQVGDTSVFGWEIVALKSTRWPA